ncbi:helix-turn-helix domain-containing protein [Streptomyces sp. NBC_00258]|uniref:helix-turn-helix domain-containing protein n=1 Tax=Streptomyces sp. NBC_00258 TaxID=2903642 RepID=UPI002E2B0E97|nr:helix-turn-helix transcriptional regulator [Streptomyces sp. NBC_00258]
MTDAPTRAQRFAAVVAPAAQRAGYTGHGSQARLARDTGMSESSVSRMLKGKAVPDLEFIEPLAQAIEMDLLELLTRTGIFSPESLPSLSESDRSQVGSRSIITPEEAADGLGIKDEVGRQMLAATIERLRRLEDDGATDHGDDAGGSAAHM